jgi:hypothetical protein
MKLTSQIGLEAGSISYERYRTVRCSDGGVCVLMFV